MVGSQGQEEEGNLFALPKMASQAVVEEEEVVSQEISIQASRSYSTWYADIFLIKFLQVGGNGEEKKEGEFDYTVDERYKNLDPRVINDRILFTLTQMIELIENEIMERQPDVTWNDIAGLDFAKKTINEIIIWPM